MDDQRYLETGDPHVFASLYGRHRGVVLTELKAAGLPVEAAESRISEVFVRMMDTRCEIDRRRSLGAVLRELARDVAREQGHTTAPIQPPEPANDR